MSPEILNPKTIESGELYRVNNFLSTGCFFACELWNLQSANFGSENQNGGSGRSHIDGHRWRSLAASFCYRSRESFKMGNAMFLRIEIKIIGANNVDVLHLRVVQYTRTVTIRECCSRSVQFERSVMKSLRCENCMSLWTLRIFEYSSPFLVTFSEGFSGFTVRTIRTVRKALNGR